MPTVVPPGSDLLGRIRALADQGDHIAQALFAFFNATYYVAMSAGAEAGNVIRVTGQVTDTDGQKVAGVKDVLVTSVPIAGTGFLAAVSAHGTVKVGAASTRAWVQTLADGSFQLDVANAVAEDTLIVAALDNGTTEMLKLTYA